MRRALSLPAALAGFCLVLALLFSAGCAYHQTEVGARFNPADASLLVEGQTTEAEALAVLGQPYSSTSLPNGGKLLTYLHSRTEIYQHPRFDIRRGGSSTDHLMLTFKNGVLLKKSSTTSFLPVRTEAGTTIFVPDRYK